LACGEDEVVISVASKEVDLTIILLLPLVVFRAGALDAGLLLPRLPLHQAKARGEGPSWRDEELRNTEWLVGPPTSWNREGRTRF
jgi:hypothetical protein